ncbi:unnamed protein product [Protopolystoma xenopodis]|uniref:Uncharacterized protein n=1 Tax=Protopolystoma xenopodis TaxID=117903 RepID=A0A3S5FFN1_9PLAT|nr:unnamed protein product [Protopolystoma xenopodis]
MFPYLDGKTMRARSLAAPSDLPPDFTAAQALGPDTHPKHMQEKYDVFDDCCDPTTLTALFTTYGGYKSKWE